MAEILAAFAALLAGRTLWVATRPAEPQRNPTENCNDPYCSDTVPRPMKPRTIALPIPPRDRVYDFYTTRAYHEHRRAHLSLLDNRRNVPTPATTLATLENDALARQPRASVCGNSHYPHSLGVLPGISTRPS